VARHRNIERALTTRPRAGRSRSKRPETEGAPARASRLQRRAEARTRDLPPGESRWIGYLYIAPAVLVIGTFVALPLLDTVRLSFFEWDGLTDASWVGLDNYKAVFRDGEIKDAFVHAAVLIFFFSILPVGIGLLLAASLSRMRVRGITTFRVLLFLPQVIASVVVGISWRWILAEDGPFNAMLDAIGLDGWTRAWLGDFTWALPAIGLIGTWVAMGLAMVLLVAAAQHIPITLYEAARVDGVGPVGEFFAVTLPGVRNQLAVVLAITMINALRTFDLIFVTTQGGPGNETMVPAFLVYQRAFLLSEVGLASAVAVLLAAVIMLIVVVTTRAIEVSE
jgi:raffinose/stachyose/melibiose transport system permease protein